MNRFFLGEGPGITTREPFSQKLQNAKKLIEYLESKGINPTKTRLGEYIKFFEKYISDKCTEKEIQDNLLLVTREMDEWNWIHKGLKVYEPDGCIDLLKDALAGPAFAKNELTNTHPRNIQLELRIGSYFLQAGYDIKFSGLSDLVVDVEGYTVFVECKRLNSSKQVIKRAKASLRQLRSRYKSYKQPSYGLVVLDISRIIHPKQGVTQGANAIITRDGIRKQIDQFNFDHDTQKIFEKDKKLISVWLHAVIPMIHLKEKEVGTRFSSDHTTYAREGQRRWSLFLKMQKAFEIT